MHATTSQALVAVADVTKASDGPLPAPYSAPSLGWNWQPGDRLLPLEELDEEAHLAEELYVMFDVGWNRLWGLTVDDEVDGRLSLGAETEPASLDLQPAPHAPRHAMSAA